jgi:hypothetical protein
VIKRLYVQQQLCYPLSHDTAKQSSFQQNIDSQICNGLGLAQIV